MDVERLLKEKREEILRMAAKHGARNVRVFGSVACGEADERSDIDLLVEFEPGRSLLDQAGLVVELEELLGRTIDVVTEGGLYWLLRRRILKEAPAVTKDPRVYVARILECIQKIERFTADGRERFFWDAMVKDAVLRNVEVIGEAAKRLDDAYWAAHPEVPWRAMRGLHDMLSHQYERVDLKKVWAIVEKGLPHCAAPSLPCCPWRNWNASWPGRTNRWRSREHGQQSPGEAGGYGRAPRGPRTIWLDRPVLYGVPKWTTATACLSTTR
jgi:uncharacterized protein with HEPN domain/predicted nucleotidyltransferase